MSLCCSPNVEYSMWFEISNTTAIPNFNFFLVGRRYIPISPFRRTSNLRTSYRSDCLNNWYLSEGCRHVSTEMTIQYVMVSSYLIGTNPRALKIAGLLSELQVHVESIDMANGMPQVHV